LGRPVWNPFAKNEEAAPPWESGLGRKDPSGLT